MDVGWESSVAVHSARFQVQKVRTSRIGQVGWMASVSLTRGGSERLQVALSLIEK